NTALATGAGGPATSRAIAAVDAGSDGAVRSGDMAGGALRRIGSTAWADGGRTAAGVATVSGVLSASRARASRVSANGMMASTAAARTATATAAPAWPHCPSHVLPAGRGNRSWRAQLKIGLAAARAQRQDVALGPVIGLRQRVHLAQDVQRPGMQFLPQETGDIEHRLPCVAAIGAAERQLQVG